MSAGSSRHFRGRAGARSRAPDLRRAGAGVERGPGRLLVPEGDTASLRAARASLHCTTFRGPARAPVPMVLTVHDLALLRAPGGLPAVASPLRGEAGSGAVLARPTSSSRSPSSRGTRRRARRRPGGADHRRPERRRRRLHARRSASGGEYVLAVATLEPRKNLRRAVEAARAAARGAPRRRCAGVGRVDVEGWVGEVPDRSSRRCTAARAASSIRPSTRASGCRCSRRWHAARPS